jgi:hypothetical protein
VNIKGLVSIWFLLIGATGFSQGLSLQSIGEPFECSTSAINWDAPTNTIPSIVWIYHLQPKPFPSEAISNLIATCGFTDKDLEVSNKDIMVYLSGSRLPDRQLGISSSHGTIYYESVTHYGPTNMAKDVPEMSQMLNLTINFLSELNIDTSEIPKNSTGLPNFRFWEPFKEYFLKDKTVTNIEFRAVDFRRSVDGALILGGGTAGNGQIFFGEHGKPVKIDIAWPNMERYKSYPTVAPDKIVKWIGEGKAVHGGISMNLPDIDWSTIKSLTIHEAKICYNAGSRLSPSDWLMPLITLRATVDTGQFKTDLQIDCPVIVDTKPYVEQ